ncbi:dihydrolipoyllysine-residue acetyltransferase [Aquabacterium sp. CECT 9606]|uniref:dihydrolipoyllysine-residue acetyltransferase n=1 Tax=Aquabacterium sp. CECT 9606 TaxID=2845822 RepID=UPI001E3F6232|nr:Dihydrolipoyllysine-residue acetyltransferase component of pyruvate dehydrogenase complex [Aquabacterium sp. CECT 9606]
MTETIELQVPDIGDYRDVSVIELLVKPGDRIQKDQSLLTVESDKAAMEIPASHGGVLKQLLVKLGDKVSKDSLIAVVELQAEAPSAPPASIPPVVVAEQAASALPPPAQEEKPSAASVQGTDAQHRPHASPSIRQLARELNVGLADVRGTGLKGRITREDVIGFVKQVMAGETLTSAQRAHPSMGAAGNPGPLAGLLPWPQIDFEKFGPIERKARSRIKKISGANLHRNWVLIPHVTNHEEADITELEALRVQLNKEHSASGLKVTLLAFLIKAAAAALKRFPEFNASLDGEQLILKHYIHIGFAADTPNGLVVPVIKDVDKKGILEISREMGELAAKAREGKLAPADMSGGCFSISSLGGIGGTGFTPIINAPEVAIMGVCRSQMKPVWDGTQFLPRLMLPLSLSWDHRVIDGAAAGRFNAHFAALLADFRRIAL